MEIYYIMPDCPSACADNSPLRTTRDLRWSPSGGMLIIEAQPSDIGRRGVFVRSAFDANNGVAPLPYDYGYWSNDGFFFQAEDGIRDGTVTGVQTCALPISGVPPGGGPPSRSAGVRAWKPNPPRGGATKRWNVAGNPASIFARSSA